MRELPGCSALRQLVEGGCNAEALATSFRQACGALIETAYGLDRPAAQALSQLLDRGNALLSPLLRCAGASTSAPAPARSAAAMTGFLPAHEDPFWTVDVPNVLDLLALDIQRGIGPHTGPGLSPRQPEKKRHLSASKADVVRAIGRRDKKKARTLTGTTLGGDQGSEDDQLAGERSRPVFMPTAVQQVLADFITGVLAKPGAQGPEESNALKGDHLMRAADTIHTAQAAGTSGAQAGATAHGATDNHDRLQSSQINGIHISCSENSEVIGGNTSSQAAADTMPAEKAHGVPESGISSLQAAAIVRVTDDEKGMQKGGTNASQIASVVEGPEDDKGLLEDASHDAADTDRKPTSNDEGGAASEERTAARMKQVEHLSYAAWAEEWSHACCSVCLPV